MYLQEKLLFADAPAAAQPLYTPDLQGLVKWLETQDPTREYDWDCVDGTCLMDQFAHALSGGKKDWFGPDGYYDTGNGLGNSFPIAGLKPWTYGAALARAKALLNGR